MSEKEFIGLWFNKINSGMLKKFPDDFLSNGTTGEFALPGIELILGEELFGKVEILDTKKNCVLLADDLINAKYILYANRLRIEADQTRHRPKFVKIPADSDFSSKIVKEYENHIDQMIKEVESDFHKKFPKSKNSLSVINEIFNSLNLKRY